MRRRRPKGRTIYTISYLLDKQPKALQKDPRYGQMMASLEENPRVLQIKFNRRCYSLLHNGVIKPEHLSNFHRTYRLPVHPFFGLFFQVKRDYLHKKQSNAVERKGYIKQKMDCLPGYIQLFMSRLSNLEKEYRGTGASPLFTQRIIPKSKKRVNEYHDFTHLQWIVFFEEYLKDLSNRYGEIPVDRIEGLKAQLILKVLSKGENDFPKEDLVKRSYRKFSKVYHPDRGGDHHLFIKLKWARDRLIHG